MTGVRAVFSKPVQHITVVAVWGVLLTCGLMFTPVGGAADSADSPPSTDTESAPAKRDYRLREGSELVERRGSFRETGGRIAFYLEGENDSFHMLENLALERVSNNLDASRVWLVTGDVTEYRGANYLMLRRAVLTARSAAAAKR